MPGKPPYYKYYPNDIEADGVVQAMTCEEFGAYQHLLNKAWFEEPAGSIPDDDKVLARWTRLTQSRWKKVKCSVLAAFKKHSDGRWHQKRMKLEFNKMSSILSARSKAGKASADHRLSNTCWNKISTNSQQGLMTSEYDSKEGGCRGGENSEQSPESLLATEWLFYHKGKTNNACSLEAIMPVMAELLRLGHNFDAIKAKITDPKRRKTETAWEFERHWKGVEAVPVADPSEPLVYAPDRPYPTYAPVNRPETPEEKQARLKAKAAYLQGGAA